MKNFINKFTITLTCIFLLGSISCKKFFDVNIDPDNLLDAPMPQLLTSATVNIGFNGGSDLMRFSSLLTQQLSGQSTGAETQTQQFEKYQIAGSDLNNAWSSKYAGTLNDLEFIISKAKTTNSPHYAGVAKLLKAYTYQIAVDTWGSIPFSETQKLLENVNPRYDQDETIYNALFNLIDEAITDLNSPKSTQSPGANSTIYPGEFAFTKDKWIKFANTLKLRMYLHYSEKDPSFVTAQMNSLVSSGTFFESNEDNFQMYFQQTSGAQNPIAQFEVNRKNYLVANKTLVDIMNTKSDPRRPLYFTEVSGNYVGAEGGAAPEPALYSHIGSYLTGQDGEAPIRMLTFAEYNFIRAEAALRFGVVGDPDNFFQKGIVASMQDAGVAQSEIDSYLASHGSLTGTAEEKLKQIMEEKFVANFGVVVEPWTDWRRTGYPAITPPVNAVVNFIPRSLYYPQSEIDLNPNAEQKTGMNVRVFWDVKQ